MRSNNPLYKNASWIAELKEELARLKRELKTASLAKPSSEMVLHLEEEVARMGASVESLITKRLNLHHDAVKEAFASQEPLWAAREQLTELIKDAWWYAEDADWSEALRKEVKTARQEAIIKRASVAKELVLMMIKDKRTYTKLDDLLDDMLEARIPKADRGRNADLKVRVHAFTETLGELGVLHRDIDNNEVYKALWSIVSDIEKTRVSSIALAVCQMFHSQWSYGLCCKNLS